MSFHSEIAATEYYIRQTLKGSVALSAFTTTIQRQPLTRGAALPAMVYTLNHAHYVNTLEGVRVFARLRYRISALGLVDVMPALAEMDSIAQGLFGSGGNARVGVTTPYGVILTATIEDPRALSYTDEAEKVEMLRMGFECIFEVK